MFASFAKLHIQIMWMMQVGFTPACKVPYSVTGALASLFAA